VILRHLQKHEGAIESFDQALAMQPELGNALLGRARSLMECGRFEDALRTYEKAIASKSDWVDAMISQGFALGRTGRYQDSLGSYHRALLFEPDSVLARTNRALNLLVMGDLRSGFREFEWRLEKLDRRKRLRAFGGTRWLGQEDVAGKTILLHWEQGLGDTLQFVRFVPILAGKGAKVFLQVQAPLVPLLRGFPGSQAVLGPQDPLPPFDLHSPLMSVALALDTTLDTIPANIPYISTTPERDAEWLQALGSPNRPRVGIAWSGSPGYVNDRSRSTSLEKLLPLLSQGVELISLQKELRDSDRDTLKAHPEIRHFGAQLRDFSDTASLVSLLDLVISVDTAVAHLAGAMGKPVWLLLPFAPDWRWLLNRDSSLWYPTARLFRQSRTGDWDGVIRRVAEELPKFLASRERADTRAPQDARASRKKSRSPRHRPSGRK
jgi:tetratricopeptide (TPR) repeat protein